MTEKRYKLSEPNGAYLVDGDKPCAHWINDDDKIIDLLNDLVDENEQLRQRNDNQYNQLTELWEIIEEENWEKLIAMKKQLKEDEERLQQEWKHYE